MTTVHTTISEGIARITLDNPPLNVTTLELTRSLHQTLRSIADDASVRAVVLTGAGERAFNAGSDITEMPALIAGGDVVERKIAFENQTFNLLENLPQATIAALNGVAYGGGLELAMCCDFIVGEEGLSVGMPEIKLGLFPGAGGAVRAARRIGKARATELVLLGDPLPTERAVEWGLINRVVPRGESLSAALHLARRLAEGPSQAVRLAKESIALAYQEPGQQPIRSSNELFRQVCATRDAAEGVTAFIEKRTPVFMNN
ncbi:enoyl-CoA hydratase/isomerase family protein [Arthrobacter sp. AFG20]|uniref:enoyl-CoA hydratase/isomerase family protein n=1 Tax=Arthrobacter sp. AFG20 TaxID=1688671 RepID=UPI000C9DE947|nr:enoyl-CoA hydratase-related protein [Arthrobacter sp. AFG20]PNH78921.1 3-hydroxypropionyl-CoA dehydratase [Arthrobacter sp. AFG20]